MKQVIIKILIEVHRLFTYCFNNIQYNRHSDKWNTRKDINVIINICACVPESLTHLLTVIFSRLDFVCQKKWQLAVYDITRPRMTSFDIWRHTLMTVTFGSLWRKILHCLIFNLLFKRDTAMMRNLCKSKHGHVSIWHSRCGRVCPSCSKKVDKNSY